MSKFVFLQEIKQGMRAVIQRVSEARVDIDGQIHTTIGHGFMVLLGIAADDNDDDAGWLAGKIALLRICSDEHGQMNKDISETNGELLVVSQFTLHAAYKKGNRPSFMKAARPEQAIPLYASFISALGEKAGRNVKTGRFGADMKVCLVNDGPVTIIMDSKSRE